MSGQLADTCAPAGQQVQTVCYGGDVLVRDGQAVAEPNRFQPAIEAYEKSWTHRTLAFQYSLANDVDFINAPWLGTHNSFNSLTEVGPALSPVDSNQQLSLTDQLRIDMRALEIDVHWFPSVRAGGAYAPVVCHAGAVSEHDGCSTEPLLGPVLDQIAAWAHAHPTQALLLYIEDHLDSGYDTASAAIKQSLGSLVYPTGSSNGTPVEVLDQHLTRDKVLGSGHQIVLVSNSHGGGGAAWRSLVFTWNKHLEQTPHGFQAYPACGPDYTRSQYDSTLVRYYEDSTWLSAGQGALTNSPDGEGLLPSDVTQMVRCGVDLFGFDQIEPDDGRLNAAVWSWADGQPRGGSCAYLGASGRWASSSCGKERPAGCVSSNGSWVVTDPVTEADAAAACGAAGATFTAPRTGYQNELLKTAAGGSATWIGLEKSRHGWRAT